MKRLLDRAQTIQREFDEPLNDIIGGFIPMGLTRVEVAETLDVDPRSLRTYCEKNEIHFPRNQSGRRERIRDTRRRRAATYELDGSRYCLTELAEMNGLKRTTLRMRLSRGKSLREALSY